MLFGVRGFFKTQLDVEQVCGIIQDCTAEYGDLGMEVLDKSTARPRRVKKLETVRKRIAAGNCASVIALIYPK